MKLTDILQQKRSAILAAWFQKILEQYPADTSGFIKKERDVFANPVGNTLRDGIESLLDCLLQNKEDCDVLPPLDQIVRIKAVQEFSPSQAIAFVFLLKPVIREQMNGVSNNEIDVNELLELESGIDRYALLAFDIYEQCRETIYQIKANRVKNMSYKLLQRSDMLSVLDGTEEDGCGQSGHVPCGSNGGCQT